jgi:hypothetical protein
MSTLFSIDVGWIAVFIAGLALLVTLLRDFIVPWFLRPRISMTLSNRYPSLDEGRSYIDEKVIRSTWLRAIVRNNPWIPEKPAQRVRVKVLSFANVEEERLPFEFTWLSFSSRPKSCFDPTFEKILDIGPGESHPVDLFFQEENGFIHPAFLATNAAWTHVTNNRLQGTYRIILSVSGDNFPSQKYLVKVKFASDLSSCICSINKVPFRTLDWLHMRFLNLLSSLKH